MTEAKKRPRAGWKTLVSTALFIVIVGLLVWYVYTHWDEMSRLLSLSPLAVAELLALGLCSLVINCLYHLAILRTYGLKLTLTDWMGVVCVSNTIAFVLPMRADLLFSAAYYKRVKGLAYTRSIAMGAGNIVFGVSFSLVQILIALLCMGLIDGLWPPLLWGLLAAGSACLGFFLFLSLRAESGLRAKLEKHRLVADVIRGFNALLRNRKLLWDLLWCLMGGNLTHLLTSMVCFQAVGMPVTLYEALFFSSVGWLAGIVAIVPGNLGLKESVMGVATLAVGALFSEGVAVSLLDRATMMVVYILMGLVFAIPVWRRFNRGQATAAAGETPANPA